MRVIKYLFIVAFLVSRAEAVDSSDSVPATGAISASPTSPTSPKDLTDGPRHSKPRTHRQHKQHPRKRGPGARRRDDPSLSDPDPDTECVLWHACLSVSLSLPSPLTLARTNLSLTHHPSTTIGTAPILILGKRKERSPSPPPLYRHHHLKYSTTLILTSARLKTYLTSTYIPTTKTGRWNTMMTSS